MSNLQKLFTVQDSDGRYVSKNSIWYEKETGEWHYTSRGGYKIDNSKKNLDTGVILCSSYKEAEGIIKDLKANLHKVKNISPKEFFIKEIV